MGYESMIKHIDTVFLKVGFNKRVILREIKFILTELKQSKKLGLLSTTDKKELISFVDDLYYSSILKRKPMANWEYGVYFRLVNKYLDFKEGAV